MSLTLETYIQGSNYIECRWDKYNGFEVIEGIIGKDKIVYRTQNRSYANEKSAIRAFKNRVRKLKAEES